MKNIIILLLLFTGIVNAQIVNIPDANFKAALLSNPNNVGLDGNLDGEIQLSEAMAADFVDVSNANITSLEGIQNFTALTQLSCNGNLLSTLTEIQGLTTLSILSCGDNQLSTLEVVENLTGLIYLSCGNNQLTTLDLTGCINLGTLDCSSNQLTNLNLSPFSPLGFLDCQSNQLTSLDLSGLPLVYMWCTNNLLSTLLVDSPTLLEIWSDNNLLTTLDVSNCSNLNTLFVSDNELETLFLKNGSEESDLFGCDGNPNLNFICADEFQIAHIQEYLVVFGMTSTLVHSYCSFVLGGDYNTINGTVRMDFAGNGCDPSDAASQFVRIGINDGLNSGSSFTDNFGNFVFHTTSGNFTLTPEIEENTYFAITPIVSTVDFPAVDNSISVNDFCITANGIHPDVEIVIAPVGGAQPGFNANYKIVYKNKGNQTLTGNLTFIFNDALTDLVFTAPAADITTAGMLTFNYTDLMPFENREILVMLNVNAPTDTPPVNINDAVNFTATINPITGDETPDDNTFTLNQTVVGSFDPNDITCLEGDTEPVTEIGKYLHYIIKFENTGTAPAQNIVVADMINTADFDLSSLQIMNSSHPMEAKITGNKVEFIFEGINLPSRYADPIGGHGNVLFKIKTLNTLTVGAVAENEADIFFDYNFPIETNLAQTTFQLLTNTDFIKDESVSFYPNPANDFVKIKAAGNISSIQLFDIQGRILQTAIENKDSTTVDISNRQNGIYFIKVMTELGSSVEKIIKE